MLLVSRLFKHESPDLKADIPNFSVNTNEGRKVIVRPRFRIDFWLEDDLGEIAMPPDRCQQLHATQQHAMFPCASPTSTDEPKFQNTAAIVALLQTSRTCPPAKPTKKTYRPKMRINSDQDNQFVFVFCCGMDVATPKIHHAARTSKFVAVKRESACKTSDAC